MSHRRPGRPRLLGPGTAQTEQQPETSSSGSLEVCAVTTEPINIRALRDLASRRAAASTCMPGTNMTVRELAFYFIRCCTKSASYSDGTEVGLLTVVWREAACAQEFGIRTRRFSGFEPFLDKPEACDSLGNRFRALGK